jgi:hypothetical protein
MTELNKMGGKKTERASAILLSRFLSETQLS